MSDGNIRIIDTKNKNEMIAAVEEIKRSLPQHVEFATIVAKIRRAHYEAHVEEGFTEAEALELCKSTQL